MRDLLLWSLESSKSQKFKELTKGKMHPDGIKATSRFHKSFFNVCVKHKHKFFSLSRVLNAAVSGLRSSLFPFQLKDGLLLARRAALLLISV